MQNVKEWLESPGQSLLSDTEVTIIQELAQLVVINGGILGWNGCDNIRPGGPYGRQGLALLEAIRLTYLTGILDGFTRSAEESELLVGYVTERLQEEVRRGTSMQPSGLIDSMGKPLR